MPVTTTVFTATTPKNTPFAYHASTLTNPNPTISPAFMEANYEILESLLRERRRQIRIEDLRTEIEYFSEDYDEERDMEPRPEPRREATPTLRLREGNRRGRNAEGIRPSEIEAREGENRGANLPPPLAAHLGRNENSQPLRSYLTSVQGGHQSSTNMGGNLPPNSMLLSHHAQPFIPSSLHTPAGLVPTHINPYSQPFANLVRRQAPNFFSQTQMGFVHGLRTRSLVEHLSTDLPSTYKGLMEKTYTWVEAGEVATNGASNDQRDGFERSKKSSWDNNRGQKNRDRFSPYQGPSHGLLLSLSKSTKEILTTEKAARSFEPPPKMFGSKRSWDTSKYCHFHEDYGHDTNDYRHLRTQIQEAVNSGQLSHLVKGIKKERTKLFDTT
ncbi:hypothetical protein Tco_1482063 [Tanacetum coccineum]